MPSTEHGCLENAESQTRDSTAHDTRFAPRLPVRQVAMQGQTSLLGRAQRVQQEYDLHLEEGLFLDLAARVQLSTRDWQRLGDPRTIILESELMITLAARLRTAPWATVVMVPRSGGALMALLLINTLLTAVRGSDDSGGFDALKPLVLQTVVRQVCCRRACCCLGDCTCYAVPSRHTCSSDSNQCR